MAADAIAYHPLDNQGNVANAGTDDEDNYIKEPEDDSLQPGPRVTGAKSSSREVDLAYHSSENNHSMSNSHLANIAPQEMIDTSEQVALDEDVYGAALFTLTVDTFELLVGKDYDGLSIQLNIYRFCFVILLLVGNYILQFSLLYWIYKFCALRAMHTVQSLYKEFHAKVFSGGELNQELWHQWGEDKHDELCQVAFVSFDFMYAVLCLWWVNMVFELRKTERLMRKFKKIPSCTKAENTILFKDDLKFVARLTSLVRKLLWCTLLLPKFMIGLVLTVVGTMWLAATDSYSDLILNALALQFVINIDELLFEGLLPESIKTDIGNCKLLIPKTKISGDRLVDAKSDEEQVVGGFRRSTLYTLGIWLVIYLYMTVGQDIPLVGVFPGNSDGDISSACPTWFEVNTMQICRFGKDCFPFSFGTGHAPNGD